MWLQEPIYDYSINNEAAGAKVWLQEPKRHCSKSSLKVVSCAFVAGLCFLRFTVFWSRFN